MVLLSDKAISIYFKREKMNANNSIFVIYHVEGFDYEGETKNVVATRFTTEEAIEQEVSHLNHTVDRVHFRSPEDISWKYFDYEKLEISEEGSYSSFFGFSSEKDSALNKTGLRNKLIADFDHACSFYQNREWINNRLTLKEYLMNECFHTHLKGDVYFSDLMEIAKELHSKKLIKTDVNKLIAQFEQYDIYERLSSKFNVNIKKKAA